MSEAVAWNKRVRSLKQHLEDNPQAGIPELQLVTEKGWLDAAHAPLETEKDYRKSMAGLRATAQGRFTSTLYSALQKYMAANGKSFPTDLSPVRPYFDSPVDEAMFQRYTIIPSHKLSNLHMGGEWVITQKNAVDEEYDRRDGIPNGYGSTSGKSAWDDGLNRAIQSMKPAMQAYAAANSPKEPFNPDELLPYLTTDEQRVALERLRASRERRD